MKIPIISLLIILISTVVYAKDVFPDRELKRLQVVEINVDAGKAWIQDADGNEAEISTGDTVGIERGVVIKIDEASITVQIGNTRTKMPVVYGFE
ncbi:MAG: hypothetical protein A2W05_02165 [Candidatus Schekmanbacteria bacterium RBG_16_38_10]|uniref:Uncharacterized protein n=1 Tax=Candidatus Schekmanbacteria bacterium RBG_16_38_10 TaxID=1817879 RepID=A0A1F7RZ74_9BACT|nr:MAG: hypothetical protein A2W05_02165 [Candidatus Schekmanbacteria bacterium RBG_16_38_10]